MKLPHIPPQNTDFAPRLIIPAALYHVPAQRLLVLLFFTMVTSDQHGGRGCSAQRHTRRINISSDSVQKEDQTKLTADLVNGEMTGDEERQMPFLLPHPPATHA